MPPGTNVREGTVMSVLRRIGVLAGAGVLALSTQACTSANDGEPLIGQPAPVASAASAGAAPTPAGTVSADPVPTGTVPTGTGAGEPTPTKSRPAQTRPPRTTAMVRPNRQFVFATEASGGKSMLTVTPSGALGLTGEFSDRALFVAVPVTAGDGDTYLLKTGKLRAGGEAYCLTVASGGTGHPLQVKIAACDTSERDQRFSFPAGKNGDTLLMEAGGVFVHQWSGTDRIVAQESGEGDDLTAFVLTDRGKATIPALD